MPVNSETRLRATMRLARLSTLTRPEYLATRAQEVVVYVCNARHGEDFVVACRRRWLGSRLGTPWLIHVKRSRP